MSRSAGSASTRRASDRSWPRGLRANDNGSGGRSGRSPDWRGLDSPPDRSPVLATPRCTIGRPTPRWTCPALTCRRCTWPTPGSSTFRAVVAGASDVGADGGRDDVPAPDDADRAHPGPKFRSTPMAIDGALSGRVQHDLDHRVRDTGDGLVGRRQPRRRSLVADRCDGRRGCDLAVLAGKTGVAQPLPQSSGAGRLRPCRRPQRACGSGRATGSGASAPAGR